MNIFDLMKKLFAWSPFPQKISSGTLQKRKRKKGKPGKPGAKIRRQAAKGVLTVVNP